MLYLVIERFRGGQAHPVYERFQARGRLAPEGLEYVTSFVTEDLRACYQVMRCEDRALLDAWMAAWSDLVDFEVHAVLTSAEAAAWALVDEAAPCADPAGEVIARPGAR